MKWLEISLTVEIELAEPVAEVLARHAPGGVALSSLVPGDEPLKQQVTIRAYVRADDKVDQVRERIEHDLWYLGRIRPLPDPEFGWVEEEDWEEAWKESFHPLLIGRRLRVQPAWLAKPPDDRLPIFIDPGMAFGTGTHPSTQLCLEAIEDTIRPGDLVADLGAGSGILSIAAIKLGARRSLAFDTDPATVSVCRENAERNGVSPQVEASEGSLDELKVSLNGQSLPQLVVANIFLSVLKDMLDDGLGEVVGEGGRLIVSGVLQNQLDELLEHAGAVGLETVDIRTREDWVAVLFKKPTPPLEDGAGIVPMSGR